MGPTLVTCYFFVLVAVACLIPFLCIRSIIRRANNPSRDRLWLPITGLLILPHLLVLFYVHFPLGVRTFKIPSHSMAPNLLGPHWEVPCPECPETAFALSRTIPPQLPEALRLRHRSQPVEVICPNFHRSETPPPQKNPTIGDRIMVGRFLKPRRWDLVVYHPPEYQSVNSNDYFIMRLVGLPGETIDIRDGQILINDLPKKIPEHLEGLTYQKVAWALSEMPLVLGLDEYLILGDRTESALDSRYYGPVKRDRIFGVATGIYLPFSRGGGLPRAPVEDRSGDGGS